MREETQPLDNLKPLAEGLQHATGVPFPEAVQTLRWVQAYVRRCLETGMANDLLVAMDRLGQDEAIDVALVKLASLFDLERGFLGQYLANDPTFRASSCNGG